MNPLVNQPTKAPTRKIWAVILSGAILGAIQALLTMIFPSHVVTGMVQEISPYVTPALVALAGYLTKDRAQ